MKLFFALAIGLSSFMFAIGQNEQSPIVEKDISYRNWTLKDIHSGNDVDLRKLSEGKKLVIVVYFAPWCPNWQHDAPMVERLYEKYKSNGLAFVGVSEYGTVDAAKMNVDGLKITFPIVSESLARTDRQTTTHYAYRKATGDNRSWGSPWYILLDPATFGKGDELVKKTSVINGEMIEVEGDKFIRQRLGLPAEDVKAIQAKAGEIEVCEPGTASSTLKKP